MLFTVLTFLLAHQELVAAVAWPLVTGLINLAFRPVTPLGKFLRGAGFDPVKIKDGLKMLFSKKPAELPPGNPQ